MEAPSELMQFLRSQQEQGERESEGQFTLAREKAMVKMAEFQLPIPEGWLIKVVQALVAQGKVSRITVQLTATETRILAESDSWELDPVETAFFRPDALGKPHLKHLMVGLWSVAMKDKRAFQLTLPDCPEGLRWDAKTLERTTVVPCKGMWSLSVTHGSPLDGFSGLVSNLAANRQRNAYSLAALSEYCFPCPVPLVVDGRRIDALQFAIRSGWLPDSVPLGLGFAGGTLPSVKVPRGTFEDIACFEGADRSQSDWAQLSEQLLSELESVEECCVATLLTVCPEGTSLNLNWSKVLWVQDGVLIDAEPLLFETTELVVGCFVNAEGLPTDLTTLTLRENSEREERVARVRGLVMTMLQETRTIDFSRFQIQKRSKAGAALLFLAGIGTIWAAPVVGGGLILGSLAAVTRANGGGRSHVRLASAALETFTRKLTRAVGR